MAFGARDYIVLCVDVSPSMDTAPLDESETRLETAIRIATQIVQQKMFAGSKDFVGLVLFGTSDTENDLADAGGGYQNITVAWKPSQPSLEFLQYLTTQIQPGDTPGDFLDALVVAMDELVRATAAAKKVGDKKIYLLTDAGSEYSDSGLDQICAGLKEKEIELIIVGPDIDDGGGGGGGGGDGGGGDEGGGGDGRGGGVKGSSHVIKKTPQQVAGEAVLGRVVQEVEGACFSFREALQVATFIRKMAKRQTTRFAGCVEIGQLKIPCKIFTKVMVERPASWKKLSALGQSGDSAVKLERSYHLNDEDETEVEPDDVAKGYRYGKSLVPISDSDEQAMKMSSERCLNVLGFSPQDCVCQQQTVGSSVQVVVPSPGDQHAAQALSALVHALYETGSVGVARYVWRKNAAPGLVALIPQIKASHECLMMLRLPYMEDVRQYTFGSLPGPSKNAAPTEEQQSAVDDLITNMDLMAADIDDDGETCEAFQPKLMCNPVIQRTFQCISHHALHPDDPLPEVDPNLSQLLQPRASVVSRSTGQLAKVQELFSLVKVVKKQNGEGPAAAATVWKETSGLDLDSEAPPVKKSRVEGEDVDFSMASLARGDVTEVGTLDPVADFCNLIGRKDVGFEEACRQLQQVVMKLVKESFGDTYYGKALDCLRTLRAEGVKCSKVEVFNGFLHEVKTDIIGTRYSAFWDRVVTEGVSLITSDECAESAVSEEQAKQFLSGVEPVRQSPPAEGDSEEADDLLAMM